jgi:hypothetical protein
VGRDLHEFLLFCMAGTGLWARGTSTSPRKGKGQGNPPANRQWKKVKVGPPSIFRTWHLSNLFMPRVTGRVNINTSTLARLGLGAIREGARLG